MSMAKDRKRLPLSKIRTTKRKVAASAAVTSDHINLLLRIAEL